MNFKLVDWEFRGLKVPMFEDSSGELFCTSKQLCEALQITPASLKMLKGRYPEEFECLRVTDSYSKGFVELNKPSLGIKRLRKDLQIWSEDDMISVAILSRSGVSKEFRKELKKIIKAQATRGMVPWSEHQQLLVTVGQQQSEIGRQRTEIEELKEFVGLPKKVRGTVLRLAQ